MVLAALAGAALGCSGGVALGAAIVDRFFPATAAPKDFLTSVDITADDNDDVPMPETAGKPVSFFKKQLLKDTSPWLVQPDYDRVLFINSILQILWPHLSPAIHKTVIEQAKAPLEEACKKAKILSTIRIDRLDLGTRPPRVDSIKSFRTSEDELIIEAPAFWGGDINVRVTAVIKAGAKTIDLPVDVANIQFKALTRITIKPLVETLPCLGGVTVSLMETPHFNMDFHIADSPDIMALPGIPSLVGTAIKVVAGNMLVYPNEFALPLMPNFGLPPPPKGMLHVKIVGATGLQGSVFDKMDPFVELELRKGRPMHTSTLSNVENPVWNEEFDFVVDNPKKQGLSLSVKDDDLISASVEGVAMLLLNGAECMRKPRQPVTVTLPLHAPGAMVGKVKERGGSALDATGTVVTSGSGTLAVAAGTGITGTPGSSEKKKGWLASHMHMPKALKRKKKVPGSAGVEGSAATASDMGSPRSEEAQDTHHSGTHGESLDGTGVEEGEAASAPSTPRIELPAGAPTGATLTVECTYFPFKSAQREVVTPAEGAVAAGATQDDETTVITSVRRTLVGSTSSRKDMNAKGVLTLTLKKCMNLEGSPDTYATLTVYDPHRKPIPNIDFTTEVVMNESSPRYNFRTDVVNISASSSLSVVIYESPGMMASVTSLKLPFLQKGKAKVLGRMRVPLEHVVQEGRLKDIWPLLEAQTGEVHMTLEWNPVNLDGDDEAQLVGQAAATAAGPSTSH